MDSFDICIVGAGIAGASLAAEIGSRARVLLIEGEERPGYHTTGRSAATWHQSLGDPMVHPLTKASGAFLREGGFLDRLQANAERLVRVRPVNEPAGEDTSAVVTRILPTSAAAIP